MDKSIKDICIRVIALKKLAVYNSCIKIKNLISHNR